MGEEQGGDIIAGAVRKAGPSLVLCALSTAFQRVDSVRRSLIKDRSGASGQAGRT